MNQPTFTIFTPCYNSENIIKRLFDSLKNQTYKNFEWIVIDDVSKDNTREIINKLILEADFNVKFIVNATNQMVSKNREIAIGNASGKFFIKLSHDDALVPLALENFLDGWNHYTQQVREKNNIVGVICNCVDKNGALEGSEFPTDYWIADDFEMRFQQKVKGEKCSATLTEVIKRYPFYFPDVDIYVPEDQNFWAISYENKYIYSNKTARIHIVNDGLHEHLEGEIGRGKKYLNGISFHYKNMVNKFGERVWSYSPFHFFMFLTNYIRYSRYNNISYKRIWQDLKYKKWLFFPAVLAGNLNELKKYKSFL